jgi:hypothetical protein
LHWNVCPGLIRCEYSDTPTLPLVPMQFTDLRAEPGK